MGSGDGCVVVLVLPSGAVVVVVLDPSELNVVWDVTTGSAGESLASAVLAVGSPSTTVSGTVVVVDPSDIVVVLLPSALTVVVDLPTPCEMAVGESGSVDGPESDDPMACAIAVGESGSVDGPESDDPMACAIAV